MTDREIPQLEEVRHLQHVCLAAELRSAARAATKFYTDRLTDSPIGVAQLALLMRLYLLGEVNMVKLAQEVEDDRTTIARNVELLKRDGFVQVTEAEDRRLRLVKLTDAGVATLKETIPKWQQAQAAFLAEIGASTWRNLMHDLRSVAQVEQKSSS